MIKFLVLFLMFIGSAYADPTLVISANKTDMAVNETATLTFTFSQAVTGFDATKIFATGGTVSGFAGTGASYSATFTKTDILEASVQVQNNDYLPTGTGAFLGFNTYKKYYKNSGALFNTAKVEVQARCPLTGETLVNPSTAVYTQLFTKEKSYYSNSSYFLEVKNSCLVVLQAGQSWQPKAAPSAVELANLHGVHNHTGLYPKISTQQIPTTSGAKDIRVRPINHDLKLPVVSVGTSTTSNSMAIGSHTFTTNVALNLAVNVPIQLTNSANTAQFMRARVTSNTGTSLVVNVTQANAVATTTSATWDIGFLDRANSGGHPALDGAARFQFISCLMGFFDPITKQGQKGAAHHHTFYGNCNINENTNSANIHTGTSSAAGGIANQTGYWAPSVIDTATGVALNPSGIQVYYKVAGPTATTPVEKPPQGLRIISGNHLATTPQSVLLVSFSCTSPTGLTAEVNYIPVCPAGSDGLRGIVHFPNCVQDNGSGGMVLDSTDHISHLRFNSGGADGPLLNGCPAGFTHQIPLIQTIIQYPIAKGQNTGTWRLSSDNYSLSLPGGYSYHADWMMGWRDEWAQRLIDGCNNSFIDCSAQYVGLNKGIGAGTTSGVGITSVTVVGNVATITTSAPHRLPIDANATTGGISGFTGGGYNNGYLLARITGVTGTDANAYNFDALDGLAYNADPYREQTIFRNITSSGIQSLKVIDATHLQYTLNYFPTNTTPTITGMKIQWGEALCTLQEAACPASYYGFYYPVF